MFTLLRAAVEVVAELEVRARPVMMPQCQLRPLPAQQLREHEVLAEVGRGRSNAEIGTALFMSEATVKAHVSHLLTKLQRANRVQLAILAHDAGITDD